ncbi:MAG: HYR domain-containing protein, partial [Bacteroidota bacterium]
TLTVSDRFGNSDQTSFLISVTDTTPPQITSVHNDTIVYIEDCQAFLPDYTSLVVAEDNCTADFIITQNPVAGTEIFGTENTVNIQVSDDSGNVSEINFNVAATDTIMPEIVCPSNFSIQIPKDESYYEIINDTLNYLSASDNCDIVNIYNDFNMADNLSGAQIPVGNNLISWYVEDEFGNTAVCRISATVYNQWDYYKVEENQELNHTDGLAFNYNSGSNTVISENWAMAGMSRDSDLGEYAGAAYIFRKENSEWLPHIKLYASDSQPYDNFGYAVALIDSFAFVTAPYNDAAGNNSGAVYVFQNMEGDWIQTEILTPENPQADSEFGSSVDVWNDMLIVGAEGENKAYIFEYNSGQWLQTADLSSEHHNSLANFGHSVAIYENTAVIGAYIDNTHGSFAGSAFVFEKESDIWQQKAKLISSNIDAYDEFGGSVDIFEDEIIVGAKKNSENGHYAGMAYIFAKPESGWIDTTETAILQPSDPLADDVFACDVSIYEGRVLIGSELSDPNGTSSGSLYVFDKPIAGWNDMTETQKLTPSNSGMGHYFGNSVDISGHYGIASSPGAISSQGSSGAMFVFSMIKPEFIEQPQSLENICLDTDTVFQTTLGNYDTISWEISYDSGQSFNTIEEGSEFTGYDTPTLGYTATQSLESALFRCKITNYVHSVYSDTIAFNLDSEAPIIENLETQFLALDDNCAVLMPDYIADLVITDNCNQELTIEQTPPSGTNLTVGVYSVTISAVDSQANYSEMIFEVYVEDTLPPVPDLSELPDIIAECEITELTAPTATDACEGEITATHDADLPIEIQGTYTITWTYDDGNGNISTQEQTVILEDITVPVLSCPDDQIINLDSGQTTYTVSGSEFDATASDNCEMAGIMNNFNDSETLAGEEFPIGTTTVIWTASDAAGNTANCSFNVTVNDPTGFDDFYEAGIQFYPNPTRGIIKIIFSYPEEHPKIETIQITDISGKIVYHLKQSKQEQSEKMTIDLSAQPAGIYILKITGKSGNLIEKIIKQ